MDNTPVMRKRTGSRLSFRKDSATPKTPIHSKNTRRSTAEERSPVAREDTSSAAANCGFTTPAGHRNRSRCQMGAADEGSPHCDSDSGFSPGSFLTQEAPIGDVDYEWDRSDRTATKTSVPAISIQPRRHRNYSSHSDMSELSSRNHHRLETKKRTSHSQSIVLGKLLELSTKQRNNRNIEQDSNAKQETKSLPKVAETIESSGSCKSSGFVSANNNEIFAPEELDMFEDSFELPDIVETVPAAAPKAPSPTPKYKKDEFEDLMNDSDSDILVQASQSIEKEVAAEQTVWATCNANTSGFSKKNRDSFSAMLQDSFNDELFDIDFMVQNKPESAKKKPIFGRHHSMTDHNSANQKSTKNMPLKRHESSDTVVISTSGSSLSSLDSVKFPEVPDDTIKEILARKKAEAQKKRAECQRRLMAKKSISDSQLPQNKSKYK